MDLQQQMLDTLFEQVYKKLDDIGLSAECPTRNLSWDEAACECGGLAEEAPLKLERDIYREAITIYSEAVKVWDAVVDANKLFD